MILEKNKDFRVVDLEKCTATVNKFTSKPDRKKSLIFLNSSNNLLERSLVLLSDIFLINK